MLSVYPVFNFVSALKMQDEAAVGIDEGVSVLYKYASFDIQQAEKNVNAYSQKKAEQQNIKKVLKAIDNGKTTYRKLFRNVYVVGDSLMNGLEVYDILNSNNLVTQVSANFKHLSDNIPKIIGMNPPVLILHYGINMIGTTKAQKNSFISTYSGLIGEIKTALPDTRIIVSGIFPVDRSIASAERFGNIGAYNKALKKMCSEMKIEFLDSSSVLKAHPECYGVDGIHLSKSFYSKYWLRFIVKEKGIVG